MTVSVSSSSSAYCQFSAPKTASEIHGRFNPNNKTITTRWMQKKWSAVIRCSNRKAAAGGSVIRVDKKKKNYYELLGVSVDSSSQEIKEAYRKLQKKHHPDIAGQEGHDYTLLLNEAYKVLMTEDLRRQYDASIGQIRIRLGGNNYVSGYSSWKGPLRPQAIFVDENACIGCRECVHHASNTFMMDDALGCARVKVQYGDDDQNIEVSVDSCPVNCIHWVDREELAVLEFLNQPKRKEGYGVFGQGWETPSNVFAAAKSFQKELKRQAEHQPSNVRGTTEEETPAQAEARVNASIKIKMERFSTIWNSVKEIFGLNVQNGK